MIRATDLKPKLQKDFCEQLEKLPVSEMDAFLKIIMERVKLINSLKLSFEKSN